MPKQQRFSNVTQQLGFISYKIRTAQTIMTTNNFLFFARQEVYFHLSALEAIASKLSNLFYVARKNSSTHCKFHISWRLSNSNYFPFLHFFVFTPAASTNQRPLVSPSPSSINITTFRYRIQF